jgi:hypothetical protein
MKVCQAHKKVIVGLLEMPFSRRGIAEKLKVIMKGREASLPLPNLKSMHKNNGRKEFNFKFQNMLW